MTDWTEKTNDKHIPLNREDIYICKSTFVLIFDALEWKQQKKKEEAHCDQTTTVPLSSAHSTYILCQFLNLCHYYAWIHVINP